MPHMQRITWSGIALHGGALPGYPASHGCVRMPFDFAARLFDATAMGMRVIVTPSDVAPVELAHPVLFQPKPGASRSGRRPYRRGARGGQESGPGETRRRDGRTGRQPGPQMPVRAAENLKLRGRGAIGGRRDDACLCHLGGGKGAGRGRQGAGGRQDRGAAGTMGRRQSRICNRSSMRSTAAREAAAAAETARAAAAEAARQVARAARAGVGVDQPQDPAALRPAGI